MKFSSAVSLEPASPVWVWLGAGLWWPATVRGRVIVYGGRRRVPVSPPHRVSTAVPVEMVEPRHPERNGADKPRSASMASQLERALCQLG